MTNLSFKQFLTIVNEDLEQEVSKLTSDLAMIDTQINQRTTPLLARKMQLQKLLALKQKQMQAQQKRDGVDTPQDKMQANQPSNQTTTPGSARSATPGGAPTLH